MLKSTCYEKIIIYFLIIRKYVYTQYIYARFNYTQSFSVFVNKLKSNKNKSEYK